MRDDLNVERGDALLALSSVLTTVAAVCVTLSLRSTLTLSAQNASHTFGDVVSFEWILATPWGGRSVVDWVTNTWRLSVIVSSDLQLSRWICVRERSSVAELDECRISYLLVDPARGQFLETYYRWIQRGRARRIHYMVHYRDVLMQ
jgi:hypothetical protein